MNKFKFAKIRPVRSPERGTQKSAGLDLFVPDDFKSFNLAPYKDVLIPSGLKFKTPEGYALFVNNKSGVATKKKLIKGAELIDEDYQGEVHIHLFNLSNAPVRIKAGDKLCQVVLLQVNYDNPKEVDVKDLYTEQTERGENGFGHTDKK